MADRLIGQEIGQYRILEVIGEGGMATVYKALDTHLEREVAIKVIRRDVFMQEEMEVLLKRFEREAKSLGKLSHPNIVPIIDYGEFEGAPYLVMVYLPGGTLKSRLGEPIPWREAVQLLLPIAHALEYVHDQNIINRDIKPSNILLTENGEPLLTDFGLVKIFGEQAKETTSITMSGAGLGTPDYMAPEQWTGDASVKSDMYSLGVVLYEMITGHRPYKADTPAGVLLKQHNEPLPLPTNYIPDLPIDMESVLLKVLAKDPEHRYANIRAFADELERLLSGKATEASTIKMKRLREQMTGVIEKQPTPIPAPEPAAPVVTPIPSTTPVPSTPTPSYAYAPARPVPTATRKRGFVLPAIIGVLIGGVALVAVIGSCWLVYSNPELFGISPGPGPVSQATAAPTTRPATPTVMLPSATAPVYVEPSATIPPTQAPLPEEIEDEKGVPMRLVPAGEFVLGSDDSVDAGSRPAQTIYLDAFYIDKFEVSNDQYAQCTAPECRQPRQAGSITRSTYYSDPRFGNYPVLYVDWSMAKAYCTWKGGRLPSEAEWEKAARGTEGRLYPWENQERDCFYSNLAGCTKDTTPVGQYEQGQSPYGVFDMSGNVWEWTSSLYMPYPYSAEDGRESPTGAGKRVLRGGSFHMFGVQSGTARNDTRYGIDPSYYGAYVGIRCARDVGE